MRPKTNFWRAPAGALQMYVVYIYTGNFGEIFLSVFQFFEHSSAVLKKGVFSAGTHHQCLKCLPRNTFRLGFLIFSPALGGKPHRVVTQLTHICRTPCRRRWCSGIMQDSHSCDPGSIPGRRNLCFVLPTPTGHEDGVWPNLTQPTARVPAWPNG